MTFSRSVWQETTRGNSVLSHTNLLAADTPLGDVYAAMAPMVRELTYALSLRVHIALVLLWSLTCSVRPDVFDV